MKLIQFLFVILTVFSKHNAKTGKYDDLIPPKPHFAAHGDRKAAFDHEERRTYNAVNKSALLTLNAYQKHKKLVNDYLQYYGGSWEHFERDKSHDQQDIDVIHQHGRFLWSDEDEASNWYERLAKRYWEKLFKEYCLVDLSRYKENKFGMRWRLEREVVSGKGQFSCGSIACSAGSDRLHSWEANFSYTEKGVPRNALVKLRLCPACSDKLNYRFRRRDVTGVRLHAVETNTEASTSKNDAEATNVFSKAGSPVVTTSTVQASDSAIWQVRAGEVVEAAGGVKTQEEEFDDYLSDMLL